MTRDKNHVILEPLAIVLQLLTLWTLFSHYPVEASYPSGNNASYLTVLPRRTRVFLTFVIVIPLRKNPDWISAFVSIIFLIGFPLISCSDCFPLIVALARSAVSASSFLFFAAALAAFSVSDHSGSLLLRAFAA
jgi:hypothetical protein